MDVTELVVTDLLLVIIIYIPSLLSISGHQLCQYLLPEPDMLPLHAQPVHVVRRLGCSHIQVIAHRESGIHLARERHIVHSSDTGSNQLQSSYEGTF
jgi:hypothetical protein